MINHPRALNEYIRELLIGKIAEISREIREEEELERHLAWLKTLTPEQLQKRKEIFTAAMEDLIAELPEIYAEAFSNNSNQWEKVFQSE